jgi:hypothetical protein
MVSQFFVREIAVLVSAVLAKAPKDAEAICTQRDSRAIKDPPCQRTGYFRLHR